MSAITLPDGKKIPFSKSINGFEITNKISKLHEQNISGLWVYELF